MTGPLSTFDDPQAEACTVLRTALAGRSEPYVNGVTVGDFIPTTRTLDDAQLPYVQVRVDAVLDIVYPAVSRATVRVSCWHHDEDQAFNLAQLCQGILLSTSTNALPLCTWLTGPFRTTDPETQMAVSSFTVRATVKGHIVSA